MDYESTALTAELRAPEEGRSYVYGGYTQREARRPVPFRLAGRTFRRDRDQRWERAGAAAIVLVAAVAAHEKWSDFPNTAVRPRRLLNLKFLISYGWFYQ